jgi:hypothetical protein
MQIGDLVRVHWGACDWSGTEGVDWGYSVGVVTGEIVWWENARILAPPCGDIEILFRGERVLYNLGRLEIVNESR